MKTTYWVGHTIFRAAAKAFFRYQVVGREKLITEGPVLIASNHESFLDPPLVGIAYDQAVFYLARRLSFAVLVPGFIPAGMRCRLIRTSRT